MDHATHCLFLLRAASIRLGAAVWWFFTLIMVSSYTANLAAFLVAESKVSIIENVEDFKECGLPDQPACKATFGAKKGGSTLNFFRVISINFDSIAKRNHSKI